MHCNTSRVMCERFGKGDLPPRVGVSTGTKLILKAEPSQLNTLQRMALHLTVIKQIGDFMNLKIAFEWKEIMW